MARHDPAARPERKFLSEPLVLPQPCGLVRVVFQRGVALEPRGNRRIADDKPRNLRGRGEIAVQQRGLHRQGVGVGVESERLFVGRQHGLRVDFHSKQVTNRIGVFSAVEPMEFGCPAGIHMGRRRHDPARSRARWPRGRRSRCRAAARPAAASRGFGASRQPFPRCRPSWTRDRRPALSSARLAVFRRWLWHAHAVRGDERRERESAPWPDVVPPWRRAPACRRLVCRQRRRDRRDERDRSARHHQHQLFLPCSHRVTPADICSAPGTDDRASDPRRA